MTEKTEDSEKTAKMRKVLKELDSKYQLIKKDRIELLKCLEQILPNNDEVVKQLKADSGKVDSDALLNIYKSIENEKIIRLKEEVELLRRSDKNMKEKIKEIEEQTRKQANFEGNALLAKIKNFGAGNNNPNQTTTNSALVESLEKKILNQEKLIASLKEQLVIKPTAVQPSASILHSTNKENSTQTDDQTSQNNENSNNQKRKIEELQKALDALQSEYSVRSNLKIE